MRIIDLIVVHCAATKGNCMLSPGGKEEKSAVF